MWAWLPQVTPKAPGWLANSELTDWVSNRARSMALPLSPGAVTIQ